ncbi:hypothetical protein CEXT_550291 [Caerostris extrusa]|uniref:Ycf15 n=1 Tax=Caerostris extrusa TaxID=172846 RepID=A0AAV4MBG5_CAEEX|nr:hypothetical protein CEXT_550291 [Caerostris extrusa]
MINAFTATNIVWAFESDQPITMLKRPFRSKEWMGRKMFEPHPLLKKKEKRMLFIPKLFTWNLLVNMGCLSDSSTLNNAVEGTCNFESDVSTERGMAGSEPDILSS